MRQEIKGLNNHDKPETLKEYVMDAPEGTWRGRLDELAWGKSQNLFCFFTDIESGKKYRLSTFNQKAYKPEKEGPAFDEVEKGATFEITTAKSKNGFPKFVAAKS